MDKLDRQEIEIHNTQELDPEYLAEDERPAVHPLFDELLRDFQRGLVEQAERMRNLGKS